MTDTSSAQSPGSSGPTFIPVAQIAEQLSLVPTKVQGLLRERSLVGLRRGGVMMIPAEFVDNGEIVRGLVGTITLLADVGYTDGEIIEWLFAVNDPTRRSVIEALRLGRIREAHRKAQIAGF